MYNIKIGYQNDNGESFSNIRNIEFQNLKEVRKTGKYISETFYEEHPLVNYKFALENGVYIYKTEYDENKALRIYKNYFEYQTCDRNDAYLVSTLQKLQENIKLTEFPTGVVTYANKVIGQEIPFYHNHISLCDVFETKFIKLPPTSYYLKVLDIIQELYKNNIIYSDIHAENFLINPINDEMKLIDFESRYISFDLNNQKNYILMLKNLKTMIISLEKIYHYNQQKKINNTTTLNELNEFLKESHYTLTKVKK